VESPRHPPGRIVAIKRLKGEHTARFEQEARAIAALNHAPICQIYDIGPDYLVMEFIDGTPLRGPMPVEQALRLAIQIAAALENAHARGILHRDLKPSAGHAKLTEPSQQTQTLTGAVMGTPAYMSPEQIEGQPTPFGSSPSAIAPLGPGSRR
jgi:eukaryotic-like serine/threonine-protein kinase